MENVDKKLKILDKELKKIDKHIKTKPDAIYRKAEHKHNPKSNTGKTKQKNESRRKRTGGKRPEANTRTATHLALEYEKAVQAIVLPKGSAGVRWASPYAQSETALAAPFAIIDLIPGASSKNQIPLTDHMGFVFRDPSRAAIIYTGFVSSTSYNFFGYGDQSDTTDSPHTNLIFDLAGAEQSFDIPVPYATGPSDGPHGPLWLAGSDGTQRRFFWLDKGNQMSVFTTALGSTESYILEINQWRAGVYTPAVQQSANITSTGVSNFTIAESGYYSFSVAGNASFTMSLSYTVLADTWGHKCLPGLDLNYGSVQATRIVGASLMVSNTTAITNRQGEIAIVQVPQSIQWYGFNDANGAFPQVAKMPGATTFVADNGAYGFLKPTQTSDFDLKSYLILENGTLMDSCYPLMGASAYLALYVNTTDATALSMFYTVAWTIEYTTQDIWRDTESSSMELDTAAAALASIKTYQQFHENPVHWKELWDKIKSTATKIWNGVQKYGPIIQTAVSGIAALL